uniref:Nuclear pore complex protein Nup88-like isoform X1 n=1 Tax=Dermatophagoides pteronyssinus TaxID=6956 RepID=A0A6P6XWM8_DERPT|nr:nuclear pore complex protein Nup88-like isoform X1 [Dermatophagoides pteronyssinus]
MASNDTELLNKLVESIKKCKFDRNIVTNLSCYYMDRLLVWNDDDQCIYGCLFDDRYNITAIQIITLSSLPTFQINEICLNPQENYLAIYGKNGCMIVELPRNWSYCRTATTTTTTSETLIDKVDPKQKQQQTTSKLLIRSFSLAERMFLTNRNLKLECLRWHPISKRHLIILTNDNRLRLFDIFNEYEPIKTVHLGNDYNSGLYSGALGENAVSFDFGPSLSQYHNNNNNLSMTMKELIDIYSIFVLKENGDVLLLYLNLKDLTTFYCQHQPLKMLPAAEDNYGSEACSILCLDCVPPIIIIGTCSGLLYHCLAIENDLNNDDDNCDNSSYQISTSKSTIIIPETVLNVFETIELSFPLATYQIMDNGQYNNDMDTISTALNLIADPKDGQRYYCQHSYGVHCVMVPFFKQIVNPTINNEFYDDKAIVEYLICTRPTIDNEQQQQQSQSNDCPTFPVGIGLTIKYGFTSITVILNTGELISKRLSNIVLSDVDDDEQNEISRLINLTESPSFGLQQQAKKPNFSEHIQRLLTKTTSLPLIKSSKTDSKCGMAELEMLLNSIDVLRNEYLDKYFLAAKAIDKRKTVLNIEIDIGRIVSPKIANEKYDTGQFFLHRVFGYRGVTLFPWTAKVYDRDQRKKQPSQTIHEERNEFKMNGVTPKPHTYYQVLIDQRDCPYVKAQTEAVTFLGNHDNTRALYAIPGLDYVAHEDVIPYMSTESTLIQHQLFEKFLTFEPDKDPPFVPKETLLAWQEKNHPWLELSDVYRETTENIRITVIPFYMGCRLSQNNNVYWWRYCVRIENLGDITVQLRERHWQIYSIPGILESIRGRGVVGEEPVLSKKFPAFQYSSHVSLQDPSGHMGIFKMEREDGTMFDCKIPAFALESKHHHTIHPNQHQGGPVNLNQQKKNPSNTSGHDNNNNLTNNDPKHTNLSTNHHQDDDKQN